MPEVEQAEFDRLTTEAGKVAGLGEEITGLKTSNSDLTTKLTTATEESTGLTTKLEDITKVNDEELNKRALADAELTKLKAAAEKYSTDENALTTVKNEKEAIEKELGEFKATALESVRDRLHRIGIKEEDTKDKTVDVLNAMEVGALAVAGNSGALKLGEGTGLNGGQGTPASQPADALAQNLKHIEELRKNSRGRAQRVG